MNSEVWTVSSSSFEASSSSPHCRRCSPGLPGSPGIWGRRRRHTTTTSRDRRRSIRQCDNSGQRLESKECGNDVCNWLSHGLMGEYWSGCSRAHYKVRMHANYCATLHAFALRIVMYHGRDSSIRESTYFAIIAKNSFATDPANYCPAHSWSWHQVTIRPWQNVHNAGICSLIMIRLLTLHNGFARYRHSVITKMFHLILG